MKVAIHQPNFLPWLGYFYKIYKSDLFVFLDNVQFTKNGYQNRVKIKTPQGAMWLTIPVLQKFGQLTKDVKINNTERWEKKHLKTFEANYRRAPYFEIVYNILRDVYLKKEWDLMADFNIEIINAICNFIGIKTKFLLASSLDVEGSSTDLLIDIIKKVGGTAYLSGRGGIKYQDEGKFKNNMISLIYTDFKHSVYPQLWGEFIEGLSTIDLLFNCGKNSLGCLIS